jgi:hypothetical protein
MIAKEVLKQKLNLKMRTQVCPAAETYNIQGVTSQKTLTGLFTPTGLPDCSQAHKNYMVTVTPIPTSHATISALNNSFC